MPNEAWESFQAARLDIESGRSGRVVLELEYTGGALVGWRVAQKLLDSERRSAAPSKSSDGR